VSNGSGSVTSQVAKLTVKVNELPVTGLDGVVTALGTPVTFPLSRLLANDTDPDGQTLFITSISSGVGGRRCHGR